MGKLLILILYSISSFAIASNPQLSDHEKGWYWHDDPKKSPKKTIPVIHPPANPANTWKLIGKMVDTARAKAILNPSVENIAHARHLQRLVVAQANLFSERWMLDLLLHPEMDESLVNPHNSNARDIYNQEKNRQKEESLSTLQTLYYFYDGGEPYSEKMATVVQDFALNYQLTIIPISMNQKVSPVFPQSKIDGGEAKNMKVRHIPALFSLHPVTRKPIPIAYGLTSQSDLKENISHVLQAFNKGGIHEN